MPNITLALPPSRASAPVDYVTRMDAWLGGDLQSLVSQINNLDASDWFSVQSSPTDDTQGKVMTVGAFGLGRPIVVTDDLNADRPTGLYYGFSGALNRYLGADGYYLEQRFDDQSAAQLSVPAVGDLGLGLRREVDGVWEDWVDVLPLRHSNALGEFVKFADGTQICFRSNVSTTPIDFDTPFFGGFRSAGELSTQFPATFSAPPLVLYIPRPADGGRLVHYRVVDTQQGYSSFAPSTDAAAAGVVARYDFLAIGKWT